MILAGLDIETTGTDYNKGHRLIQIGIAFRDGLKIAYDVQPTGDIMIQQEAMDVNRFTLERIGSAPFTARVDDAISNKLANTGLKEGDITPVGWNVGGFDMGFVKRELPKTAAFFSYRTLDLTGVAIIYELTTGKPYKDLKQELHQKIVERLGRDKRHDALYDAEAALEAVELLKELLLK